MKLTWLGHSCFLLESQHGNLVFDPWERDYVPGYKNIPKDIAADEVICSHSHNDHSASHLVNISKRKHSYEIIKIPTFHDDKNGALRGDNTITLVKFDGLKVVHFGDIGCRLTDSQKEILHDTDIAMIPVGGYYTVDAKEAYEIVKSINANIIVPMHYKGENFGFDVIEKVDNFAALFNNVSYASSNILEIDKCHVQPSVIILKPLLKPL